MLSIHNGKYAFATHATNPDETNSEILYEGLKNGVSLHYH
jgi:hypothetical protein